MHNYNKPTNPNAPMIKGSEVIKAVERITKERKAYEYKQRRDNRQTKRWINR